MRAQDVARVRPDRIAQGELSHVRMLRSFSQMPTLCIRQVTMGLDYLQECSRCIQVHITVVIRCPIPNQLAGRSVNISRLLSSILFSVKDADATGSVLSSLGSAVITLVPQHASGRSHSHANTNAKLIDPKLMRVPCVAFL